jgi:hypothetical protein
VVEEAAENGPHRVHGAARKSREPMNAKRNARDLPPS